MFVAVLEPAIVVAVFVLSSWWGSVYWNKSLAIGRTPIFYQEYFEPAVMVACHRGFVVSHPQPKALVDFLQRRTNQFYCGEIPAGTELNTDGLFQGAWRYMMLTVGVAWRWLGISWSRMGPLFGIFFGATIAVAYRIFRLGMGRIVSIGGAAALSMSTLHLSNLPHLRDYSKAPFTLALVLLLGTLATSQPTIARVLALSAAYGVVLGIGYGFRTDLLIAIPPIFVVLFVFLDGGILRNVRTKVLGAAAFVAAFLMAAQPIYSSVLEKGGGQWHVALLGLASDFDRELGVVPAPYDWGRVYEDEYVIQTVASYVKRVHPDWRVDLLGTHGYDVNSGAYLREILVRFPADMVVRAYASAWQMTDLPFRWFGAPIDGLWPALYKVRAVALSRVIEYGPLFVLLALVAASAADLRLASFLFFVVMYFGGYPAVQFENRHYFHLEFLTWWAIGFLLHHVIVRGLPIVRAWTRGESTTSGSTPLSLRQTGVFVTGVVIVLVVPLVTLRVYQGVRAREVFRAYEKAPKQPIPISPNRDNVLAVRWRGMDVRLMQVELDAARCEHGAAVTFQYDRAQPVYNYTKSFPVPPARSAGTTRMFVAIYPGAFQGLVVNGAPPGCISSASWVDAGTAPLLLDATLTPGWERSSLYQRLPIETSIF